MKRFRGFINLVFDTVEGTTNLVERTHQGVVDRSVRRFAPGDSSSESGNAIAALEQKAARGVFKAIRTVNSAARTAVDAGAGVAEKRMEESVNPEQFDLTTPMQSTASRKASWYVDYLQSTINGLFGDRLSEVGHGLDLGMSIRVHGSLLPIEREPVAAAFPNANSKICVFVHGLSATEWLWSHSSDEHYGEDDITFGTRLESDLGFTPIYIRYNSGRRVAENGRALSELLTELLDAYPVPIEEIALVGHSMGGLVTRSAAHYGREHDAPWVGKLRHVACIGSPHHGSPHAKAADLLSNVLLKVDAAAAQVIAELLETRSVGIRDLEEGTIVDEEWTDEDANQIFEEAQRNVPLVDGVGYYFVASTVTRDPGHPVGHLLGDLLVRLPSASGEAPAPARRIPFHTGAVFHGLNHFDLTSHPEVYEALRDQMTGDASE